MTFPTSPRPVALVTGVGRTVGIGAGIARRLAASGWDIAFTYWTAYDDRMDWGVESGATAEITKELTALGATAVPIEADLVDPEAPERIFAAAEEQLGNVTALVMCHCESVDSGMLDTTVESFDRHFAVNARATWLLIREYGRRFTGRARHRPDHRADQRSHGRQPPVRREQGRAGPDHPGRRARAVPPRRQRERGQPRPDRHRLDERRHPGQRHPADPARPPRYAGGHRQPGRLPLLTARPVDQRPTPPEQRRLRLTLEPCGLLPSASVSATNATPSPPRAGPIRRRRPRRSAPGGCRRGRRAGRAP